LADFIATTSESRFSTNTRIVHSLSSSFVTAARADTDTVVTEFGVAELKAQTVDERAERLIAVAHPDDRENLSRSWRDRSMR
jgi:acyl-CoA hydrolase